MRYNVKQLDKKVWVIYLIFNINESSIIGGGMAGVLQVLIHGSSHLIGSK
jgi:hypothetical protein